MRFPSIGRALPSFQDIKDDVFHGLRKKYLEAQEELEFLLATAGIKCLEDLEDG